MKKCIRLFVLFQALDILTTIIGVKIFHFIELNTLMPLGPLILFKVVIVAFVVIIMMWREADANKLYNLVWIVSAIPVVWNILNLALEIRQKMNEEQLLMTWNTIGLINLIIIIVSYGGSTIFNLLFVKKSVWTSYSWIKVFLAFCELLFCVIFSFVLIMQLKQTPISQNIVAVIILRTAIAWLGIALLFASRARYNTLIHGGERWTLKY